MIGVYEVVETLIGSIEPVGETSEDDRRYENLKAMTELVDKLLRDIQKVSINKDRIEFSVKRAGKFASAFLEEVKETTQ